MKVDKYILKVTTNWCGTDNSFGIVVKQGVNPENIEEIIHLAELEAYDNFQSFSGLEDICEELFPEVEEFTNEHYEAASEVEGEYYGWSIEPFDEFSGDDFGWYDLWYVQEGIKGYDK